ncbi:hypothetical protein [Liquorilactobacillus mali]|uniref:Uncharacterized protein n=1 Tax=Liquorilactobacillus mali KCTC 3596 = DSM 20444 TaxID=1046596 RepID=A0A0R2E3B8_9LACO|nr:hypothetical protein [Liquorilactobacillus mali]KRN10799.1 hypothetical protein FD00_GL002041 [Liquorilactobacillus mali KCTC 3596 = DSM 20444]
MTWEEEIYKASEGKVTPENYNDFNVAFYQAFIDQVASEYPSEGNVGDSETGVVKVWGMELHVEFNFEYVDENEGIETQPTDIALVEEEVTKVKYLGIKEDLEHGCYMVRFKKEDQVKEVFFQDNEDLVQSVYGEDWINHLEDSDDDLLDMADKHFELEKNFWFDCVAEVVK